MVWMEPDKVIVPRHRSYSTIINPNWPLGLVVQFVAAPPCAHPCVLHSLALLEGLFTTPSCKESVLDDDNDSSTFARTSSSFAQLHQWHTVSSIAKTPHLDFVGGLEEVPPPPSFKSPQGRSNMSGDDDDDAYHDVRGIEEEEGAQLLGTQQYDDGNNEFVNYNLLDDLMNPGREQ